ncbi:basic salivary proline-rich protein 1-like [Chroicocephalus ridibundus]|uniref:basic salivary proline-rich protein 1-like n=1 Tax=Chroicocephalus ridibundus TaxID=1192867 RepID=UPI002FDD1945
MFTYPVICKLKAQGTKNLLCHAQKPTYFGCAGGGGRPAIGGNVSYVRRLRGEELSGESRGGGGGEGTVPSIGSPPNPAALTGHQPRLTPRARLPSAPPAEGAQSSPAPAEPLPAANGQRKSPTALPGPARPCPGAQSGPAGPRGLPEQPLWQGAPPTGPPPSPSPLLRGRAFTLSPPRRPTHTQAEGPLRSPRAGPQPQPRTPGPADNEQPQLTSSAGAPWVRGGSSPPSPSPPPPPRSGIRPLGAEPPLSLAAPRAAASAGPPAALPPRGKSLYSPLQHGCSPRRRRSLRLAAAPRRRRRAAAGRAREPPARPLAVRRAARVGSRQAGRAARGKGEPSRAARLRRGLKPPPARSAEARTETAPPAAPAQEGPRGRPGRRRHLAAP